MKLSEKESISENKELTTASGIFIGSRTLSWITASACMALFVVFLTGYFMGQRRAVARFTQKLDQESFADQIYAALCGMGDAPELAENDDNQTQDEGTVRITNSVEERAQENVTTKITSLQLQEEADALPENQSIEQENTIQETANEYYAQLAGFGTAKAAQRWALRLQQKGVPVFVKKRNSRSAKGALISWYQVVTERYQDKAKLEELIATIVKEEKISDVRLVQC